MQRIPELRFSATLGEEPEIESPALYKKSLLYRNYKLCPKITVGYKLKGLA
jgi:hypothetical protein